MNRAGSKAVDPSLHLHRQRDYSVPRQFSEVEDNVEYGGNSEGNATSDEDDDEDEDDEWYPGDGICPSTSQFNTVYQASYDAWCSTAPRQTQNSRDNLLCINDFLGLLDGVPAFFCNPPKDVDLQGGSRHPLTLRSSLHLKTTEDPACEQRWKTIDYLQCIGFPTPMEYKIESVTSESSGGFPVFTSRRSGYLTSIALAWSYILSCRWAEILQNAGEKSLLSHDQGDEITTNFWDLVIRSRWSAQVIRGKRPSCAPWMMRRKSFQGEIGYTMIQVPPNSSLAFDILAESCTSAGLETELVTALAMILMLTSRNAPPPKLAEPVMIPRTALSPRKRSELSERLFRSIDKCMSLSSTQDALDSLMCSAFFNPGVPCNLIGALSLGISEALLPADNNYDTSIETIADKSPELALLWAATVCNGQVVSMLNIALKSLPPICLVAAFWTNTLQSFLQIPYNPRDTMKTSILRSCEFSTSYFCRPESSVPWSPAPPFGSTIGRNLSLEVEQHYRHKHKPIQWIAYWILRSGEKVPATDQNWLKPLPLYSLKDGANGTEYFQQKIEPYKQKIAEERSFEATSRLFNWHRHNEDGLWLDDGTTEGVEPIRKLQQHQWIVDPFDDGGRSEPVDEKKSSEMDRNGIWKWITEVDEHCKTPR